MVYLLRFFTICQHQRQRFSRQRGGYFSPFIMTGTGSPEVAAPGAKCVRIASGRFTSPSIGSNRSRVFPFAGRGGDDQLAPDPDAARSLLCRYLPGTVRMARAGNPKLRAD